MEFTAQQIAEYLKGEIQGDKSTKVHDFSKIEDGKPGTLSFLSNPKYSQYIYDSKASIILVNKDFEPEKEVSATLIRVDNAYESLAQLLSLVEQFTPKKTGISSLAVVSSSAVIGENAYIAPYAYIGDNVVIGKDARIHSHVCIEDDTKIGDSTTIYSGATVYKKCIIGNNCTIHAGAVIGGDGFGFAPTEDGSYKKIPQMGNVILEDNVDIGCNATVDRATLGSTIIRKGVKIDNLVQIAHNVEVGENTAIASQCGVAGSTKIGRNCVLAGQVGVSGHLQIADGSIFGAQTGVPNSIKTPNQTYLGYPALPVGNFRRSSVVYKNLPELQKTVFDLQKKIAELEEKINGSK
ncbi:UDP-3-O-(3-hydroxymyristoyl)glucosamine N-acyltransferase [Paludibacter sp. 221]|uniref:UDP-3-O-(3-hydroxymyristoyl)glucosamine N-acyltransferase n=1 Tax=Paludibacter sp. 221 TaxID=2302939 RepID=UPI0013D24AB4|nr:UDP-3-O-(3-hydroxymyristoyl)glucosamine N-acyltransferase [Paludibacter sp. 221]NDV45849.1 UDP-3-O-(3-hydroxymyristoyl)glucosamine N-acyltransferase [Paludibacter sp. 221]